MDGKLDLHKIPASVYGSLIFVLSTIGVGYLFTYLFFNDFFNKYNDYRVTIFSIAITLPIVLINAILIDELRPENSEVTNLKTTNPQLYKQIENESFIEDLFISSGITFLNFLLAIGIGFYFSRNSKVGVSIILGLELIQLAGVFFLKRKPKKTTT